MTKARCQHRPELVPQHRVRLVHRWFEGLDPGDGGVDVPQDLDLHVQDLRVDVAEVLRTLEDVADVTTSQALLVSLLDQVSDFQATDAVGGIETHEAGVVTLQPRTEGESAVRGAGVPVGEVPRGPLPVRGDVPRAEQKVIRTVVEERGTAQQRRSVIDELVLAAVVHAVGVFPRLQEPRLEIVHPTDLRDRPHGPVVEVDQRPSVADLREGAVRGGSRTARYVARRS